MSEHVIHRNESGVPWESDPEDAGRAARVRWRTLVGGAEAGTSGVTMGTFELPPGAVLDPHRHRPQEVYYVAGGEAEVHLDGEWRPLRAGDVVNVPGDAVHGVRNRGDLTCTVVWVFPTDSYDEVDYLPAGD